MNHRKIKFLIIGSAKSGNNQDLLREIKKRGHTGKIISQHKLLFTFDAKKSSFRASCDRLNLDTYDIFIFRGYNLHRVEAQIIAERMLFLGKVVLDEIIGRNFITGKMYESSEFSENNVGHISTFEAMNLAMAEKIIQKMKTPFLIKDNDARKGRGILKFEDKKKALAFLQKNPRGYLIQEYVPIEHDYRVMVVGGKALGAIKRYVPDHDFRTNVHGVRAENFPLSKELKKISLSATKAMNYDIAGIDILEHNGDFKIIEVNIAPEWQKFKEITGINPSETIIEIAIKKFKQKNHPVKLLGKWIFTKIKKYTP